MNGGQRVDDDLRLIKWGLDNKRNKGVGYIKWLKEIKRVRVIKIEDGKGTYAALLSETDYYSNFIIKSESTSKSLLKIP